MAQDIRLRATKDIPGINARLADGGYRTRRLKAGDEFYVSEAMAKLLVNGIKKAEYDRPPAYVPPPPAAVVEKAAAVTPAKPVEKPTVAKTTRRKRTQKKG